MSYDLKPVDVPRLTGWKLKAFVQALENGLLRKALVPRLFQEAGFDRLREACLEDRPSFYPHVPNGERISAEEAAETLKLVMGDSSATAAQARQGVRTTVLDYAVAYRKGAVSPEDVAVRLLDAVLESNGGSTPLGSVIDSDREDVMKQARLSAERFRKGEPLGPFDGVPVAVKDELDQVPYKTNVGTRFLGRDPAREDATPVARLRSAGALLFGKTNMHEIGIGVTGINPHFGPARNPWNLNTCAGGSSGGSAAAVASGLCPVAIGADGGGSIRIPASLCGVTGLKATWSRVSEFGAAPLCWSVAHVGPLAATVLDAAMAYAIIAGPDAKDSWTIGQPPVHLTGLDDEDLSGVVAGVFTPWFRDADPGVVEACEQGRKILEARGVRVKEIEIPELDLARMAHNITIGAEMTANMEKYYDEDPARFGLDVRINLALCREFTTRDYIKAQRVRTRLLETFRRVHEEVDVVLSPAAGCTAPAIRDDVLPDGESDLTVLAKVIRFATPANTTGWPAISVPVGHGEGGLPVGLQIMARPWEEHLLFRLGRVLEKETEQRRPQVFFDILPE